MKRYIKKITIVVSLCLMHVVTLSGCGTSEQKVTCTMCNGTGEVKYYYGNGDDEYNMGPCSSCGGNGYNMVEVEGKVKKNQVVCGSCNKVVDEVVTKKDAAGEDRTWCRDCWASYDKIMGE